MAKHAPRGKGEAAAPSGDAPGPPTSKPRRAFPVAALREMAMTSCSTNLARLHYQLKAAGLSTRVEFMNQLREKGLASEFLAVMTYEKGDHPYKNRSDLIAFLAHSSPKLRIAFSIVHQTFENSLRAV